MHQLAHSWTKECGTLLDGNIVPILIVAVIVVCVIAKFALTKALR
jgi:hypothetical protein